LHKDHVVLTDLNDNVVEPEFLNKTLRSSCAFCNSVKYRFSYQLAGVFQIEILVYTYTINIIDK
jgi:hypothetical protein